VSVAAEEEPEIIAVANYLRIDKNRWLTHKVRHKLRGSFLRVSICGRFCLLDPTQPHPSPHAVRYGHSRVRYV
jgi:hypothetical protein